MKSSAPRYRYSFLAESTTPFVKRQVDLALDLQRPVFDLVHPGKSRSAEAKQASLLQLIRKAPFFRRVHKL